MGYGMIVQKLLIHHSGSLAQLQIRCQLFYEDTACECERLLNCKMIFRLLYWAYQIFSGGCRSDRTDNANREQTLPHLRRSPCRIPAAPNDRRTRAAKHGKRGCRYCTECAPLSVCGRARGKLERCTFSVGSPCCVGKARIWWQGYGNPVLSDRAGHSVTEATV